MDPLDAIRLKALGSILRPNSLSWMRRICRYVSHTYSIPLKECEAMPEDELLLIYYESHYEQMSDEDLEAIRAELVATDEERKQKEAQVVKDEAADDDFFNNLNEEVKSGKPRIPQLKRLAKIVPKEPKDPIKPEDLPDINMDFGDLASTIDLPE